ncbi:hypothetical protein I302_104335 [Kwoniella bestiolae CBS 10118]|uniref:Uncharacterized protein n=1 Tax=Kwoniella bestiolae CBS 10118 TaxID=1296100 RepID=A0A1B9GAZ5_9TREE|nr:hypothetical protein I302_03043 [Kwoniella bestiolae CBS 10118]OCF28191.1 hypothetical protein I302_03043 [Kwoniella bestiolae CBS 10118]
MYPDWYNLDDARATPTTQVPSSYTPPTQNWLTQGQESGVILSQSNSTPTSVPQVEEMLPPLPPRAYPAFRVGGDITSLPPCSDRTRSVPFNPYARHGDTSDWGRTTTRRVNTTAPTYSSPSTAKVQQSTTNHSNEISREDATESTAFTAGGVALGVGGVAMADSPSRGEGKDMGEDEGEGGGDRNPLRHLDLDPGPGAPAPNFNEVHGDGGNGGDDGCGGDDCDCCICCLLCDGC